jgi:hypothetical protein
MPGDHRWTPTRVAVGTITSLPAVEYGRHPAAGTHWTRLAPQAAWRLLPYGVLGAVFLPRLRRRLTNAARTCPWCRRRLRLLRGLSFAYLMFCLALASVRLVAVFAGVPSCRPTARATPAETVAFETPARVSPDAMLRSVADWVPTGAGYVYSWAVGAEVCRLQPAGLVRAGVADEYDGLRRAFTVGQVVVMSPRSHWGVDRTLSFANHEAAHARQWAVLTFVAGPLAFPVLYGIAETFLPGRHNPFERMAGLEAGGYQPVHGWLPDFRQFVLPLLWPALGFAACAVLRLLRGRGLLARRGLAPWGRGRQCAVALGCKACGRPVPRVPHRPHASRSAPATALPARRPGENRARDVRSCSCGCTGAPPAAS